MDMPSRTNSLVINRVFTSVEVLTTLNKFDDEDAEILEHGLFEEHRNIRVNYHIISRSDGRLARTTALPRFHF